MAISLPKVCSMGGSKTALVGTIGVALLNPDGTVHTARAVADIYEIGGGCYGKNISFPDNWKGSIKWDTGGGSPVYAVEEYTVDGLVDAVIEDLDDVKGTGFVKDTDSLVDIRPETDKIQTGVIDVPSNFKADVSNLDVAVSTRNATTPPTVGAIRTEMEGGGTKLTAVKDKTDNLPASPAPASEYDTEMARVDVVLSTRSSHTAAAVWAVGARTLTSFGSLAQDIWDKLTSALTTVGSIGKLLVDNINATVSSRASSTEVSTAESNIRGTDSDDLKTLSDQLDGVYTGTPPTVGEIRTELEGAGTELDDLHKLQGLDIANSMTVTPTSREVGTIKQTISGDGKNTSTVQRTA